MSTPVTTESSILHRLADSSDPMQSEVFDDIRTKNRTLLENVRFPTSRDEDWRFLDLKPLTRTSFLPINQASVSEVEDPESAFIPESETSRLVYINGIFRKDLSSVSGLPEEVVVGNLADHAGHPAVEEYLDELAIYEEDPFVPFNGSFLSDGGFIYLPKGATLERPIQILNLYSASEKPFFATPRLLVVAEEKSQATIVEDHIGTSDNPYLTVPVSEFKVKSNAHIHHVRIQRDSLEAVHVSRPVTYVERDAEYHSYTITLGGRLTRNEPKVIQEDEEVDFTLDGLVLIDGNQIADTHSIMDHRFSHARSHQLHKVVVKGSAHSIFNGKIFVRRDAQKIDSFQENRNLLLSKDGLVNTKPQLEIFADDVLCSHGATIGQLDPEHVFYLQSRGMTEQKAKEVLTYAFALETIANVKVKSVHELLVDEVKRYTTDLVENVVS
ncbi:MAG: Fe-S cluster assembly protein SufD [Balneolaceae bacterium]